MSDMNIVPKPAADACQLCKAPITDVVIDGKTVFGPWAYMCEGCHHEKGFGFGTGKGQRYQMDEHGNWRKTDG